MFARATKAVSLVSPAYYADLACERGRCYLHRLLTGQSAGEQTAGSESGEDAVLQEANRQWHNGISPALSETMFYL
jgi:eukaryotic translation initiation factor 2C